MTATAAPEPYVRALGRAAMGALFFAFPLLMTMEMWELGFHMDRGRLALFLIVSVALILGLSHFSGLRETRHLRDVITDAFAAIAVGFAVSAILLGLFAVYEAGEPLDVLAGKTALQAMPAALGAILARRQFSSGGQAETQAERQAGYAGELFLMAGGALFIAFSVAPTEEMILIAHRMAAWQAAGLLLLSLGLLHMVVYRLGFAGQHSSESAAQAFFHFTLPGYAIALAVSLYMLWTFGRTDGLSLVEVARTMIVLGFPAAIGAALARLVV